MGILATFYNKSCGYLCGIFSAFAICFLLAVVRCVHTKSV
jgi:hypothetical protein